MRLAALALVGAIGFAFSGAPASAAPAVPNAAADQVSHIIEVAGGCGRGFYPNRWGRCVPQRSRHGYSRHRSSSHGYYSPGWRSPSDRAANQLNRQELGRYGGGMPYRGY
jgi:hypothetical protein